MNPLSNYVRTDWGFSPLQSLGANAQQYSLPKLAGASPSSLQMATERFKANSAILKALDEEKLKEIENNKGFLQGLLDKAGPASEVLGVLGSLSQAEVSSKFGAMEGILKGDFSLDNFKDINPFVPSVPIDVLSDKLSGSKVSDSTQYNPESKMDERSQQAVRDFWANTGAGDYLQRTIDDKGLQNTPLNNRFVKIGIGLAGEIGLDPLTYVSAGGGALGKGALSIGAKAATKQAVIKSAASFTDDQLIAVAKRSGGSRLADDLARQTGKEVDNATKKLLDEQATILTEPLDKIVARLAGEGDDALLARAQLEELASEAVSNEAFLGYWKGGSRGSLKNLRTIGSEAKLGDDFADGVFKTWDSELRNAVRLEVPFTKARLGLTPGGGKAFEALGAAGKPFDLLGQGKFAAVNRIGASRPGQWTTTKLSGTKGPLKAALTKSIREGSELDQLMTAEGLAIAETGGRTAASARNEMFELTGPRRIQAQKLAEGYDREAFNTEVLKRMDGQVYESKTPLEIAASRAANLLREGLDQVVKVGYRVAPDAMPTIRGDGSVARFVTDEFRREQQQAIPGGQFGDTNINKQRRSGIVSQTNKETKFANPMEVNEAMGKEMFSVDPFYIYDRMVNNLTDKVSNAIPISQMKRAGLLIDPELQSFVSRNKTEVQPVARRVVRGVRPVLDALVADSSEFTATLDSLDAEQSLLEKVMKANSGKWGGRKPSDVAQADIEALFAERSVNRDQVLERFRDIGSREGSGYTAEEVDEIVAVLDAFAYSAFREKNTLLDGSVVAHPDDWYGQIDVNFRGSEVSGTPRKPEILADTADETSPWSALSEKEFADALVNYPDEALATDAAVNRMTDEQFKATLSSFPRAGLWSEEAAKRMPQEMFDVVVFETPGNALSVESAVKRMNDAQFYRSIDHADWQILTTEAAAMRLTDKEFDDVLDKSPAFQILKNNAVVNRMSDDQFAYVVAFAPASAANNEAAIKRIAKMGGFEGAARAAFYQLAPGLLAANGSIDETIKVLKATLLDADDGVLKGAVSFPGKAADQTGKAVNQDNFATTNEARWAAMSDAEFTEALPTANPGDLLMSASGRARLTDEQFEEAVQQLNQYSQIVFQNDELVKNLSKKRFDIVMENTGDLLLESEVAVKRMSDDQFDEAVYYSNRALRTEAAVERMSDDDLWDVINRATVEYIVGNDAAVRKMDDRQFNALLEDIFRDQMYYLFDENPVVLERMSGNEFERLIYNSNINVFEYDNVVKRMTDEQFAEAIADNTGSALYSDAAMDRIAKMAGVPDAQRATFDQFVQNMLPSLGDLDKTITLAKASVLSDMGAEGIRRGQVNVGGVKAVITMFKTGDVTTIVHEAGHVFRQGLNTKQLDKLQKAYGITDGVWTREAEEQFVDDMMRFIKTNKLGATRSGLKEAFRKMKSELKGIWARLKTMAPMKAPVKNFWERVFNGTPQPAWTTRRKTFNLAKERLGEIGVQRSRLLELGVGPDEPMNITRANRMEVAAPLEESVTRIKNLLTEIGTNESGIIDSKINELFREVQKLSEDQYDEVARTLGKDSEAAAKARKLREKTRKALADLSQTKTDFNPLGKALAKDDFFTRIGSVPDPKVGKVVSSLENSFTSTYLADGLANMYMMANPKKRSAFVEGFVDPFLKLFRAQATMGRGPVFVWRNIAGGLNNAMFFGTGPADWKDGASFMLAMRRVRKRIQLALREGADIPDGQNFVDKVLRQELGKVQIGGFNAYELHRAMEEGGIFGSIIGSVFDDVGGEFTSQYLVGRGKQTLFGANAPTKLGVRKGMDKVLIDNWWFRSMGTFSSEAETFLRASTYISGLRKYGAGQLDEVSTTLAALGVKASQFDYTDLSPFERDVMRRVIPFYTWSRNNIPYQLRNLATQPGKVRLVFTLNEQLQEGLGLDDPDVQDNLPSWMQEQFGWASDLSLGGSPVAFGVNSPTTDLNKFLPALDRIAKRPQDLLNPLNWASAIGVAQDEAVGGLNPLLKFGVESATGVSTFTGSRFTDQEASPLFQGLGALPVVGDFYKTYRDPDSGKTVASGFAMSQTKNLLPIVGAFEKHVLPADFMGPKQQLALAQQFGAAALPVAPLGIVTEQSMQGEVDRRNRAIEAAIRVEAGNRGLSINEMRLAAETRDSEQIRVLAQAGGFDATLAKNREAMGVRSPFKTTKSPAVKIPKRRKPRKPKIKKVSTKGYKVKKTRRRKLKVTS